MEVDDSAVATLQIKKQKEDKWTESWKWSFCEIGVQHYYLFSFQI